MYEMNGEHIFMKARLHAALLASIFVIVLGTCIVKIMYEKKWHGIQRANGRASSEQ